MQDTSRRNVGTARVVMGRVIAGMAALASASLLAGCQTDANFAAAGDTTLAFESIDGVPRPVFDELVAQLGSEAQAHKVAVVSREGEARYRVRAYLAAAVARGQTAINWVWDVYDADGHRLTRLAGVESAGRTVGDMWAAADDRLLGRIADAGMGQLAAFAAGGGAGSAPVVQTAETAPPATAQPDEAASAPSVRVAIAAQSTASSDDAAR